MSRKRRRTPRKRNLISQRPTVARKLLERMGKARLKHPRRRRRRLLRARGRVLALGRSAVLRPKRIPKRRPQQRKRRARRSNPCFCGDFVYSLVPFLLLEISVVSMCFVRLCPCLVTCPRIPAFQDRWELFRCAFGSPSALGMYDGI